MIRVKLSTHAQGMPLLNFTPEAKGIWGDCQFFYQDDNVKEVDWWFVVENVAKPESVICPPENVVLMAQENHLMKIYPDSFGRQFGKVITADQRMKHPHKIIRQQSMPSPLGWSYKPKTYDVLKAMTPESLPKTELMSVVTSHKVRTQGQITRNAFIKAMKDHFGDRLHPFSSRPDTFGPETKQARDKWDALAPYKYYLALENSRVPHYWTTNMTDAFLAGAYPFYYGDETIYEYFSKDALTMIDINDIKGSIEIIERGIAENLFEKRQQAIWEARSLWLDKYQMFPMIANLIPTLAPGGAPRLVTVLPEAQPTLLPTIARKLQSIPAIHSLGQKVYRAYRRARYGQKYGN